ncbi:MAG: translation initiation factor IF-2 N-terminal domain-containing protein, partial [Anaerovoracaceae bacterium]
MTMKVHELAKELNIQSKELLDKVTTMGISASSHMSVLSDNDVKAVKNIVLNSNKKETKIVKAAPKKTDDGEKEQPRVTVKAAVRPVVTNNVNKPVRPAAQEPVMRAKPPMEKSNINRDLENRPKPPIGTPVIPKDFGAKPVHTEAPTDTKSDNMPENKPVEAKPETAPQGDRPVRPEGDRPVRPQGDRPVRPEGDRPVRPQGDRPARPEGDRPVRPQGDRPARPQGDRPYGDRPARPQGDRPARPQGDRPQGDRPARP